MDYNKLCMLIVGALGVIFSSFAYDEYERQFADKLMQLTGMDKYEFDSTHVEWEMPKEFTVQGKLYRQKGDSGMAKWIYCEDKTKEELKLYIEIFSGTPLRDMIYNRFADSSHSSSALTPEEKASQWKLEVKNKHTVVQQTKRNRSATIFYNDLYLNISFVPNAYEVLTAILEAGLKK